MEQRSVSEIIEQYEPLLKKYEQDENLSISEANEELAIKAGENYMSVVLRAKLKGKRGDGRPYNKSCIRKKLLENSQFAEFARNKDLFLIEMHFYKNILPLLGPYGPDCILAQPHEIILEDLSTRGFVVCERRKMLDLDHTLAVTKTLASMHASSLSLKLNSPEQFAKVILPLRENIFPENVETCIGTFFENGIRYALHCLESLERTSKVDRAINFLKSHSGNLINTMRELLRVQSNNDRYWVITHGDTWNNNIMFLHDAEGRVVRVKFVDFQVARHSSPAMDYIYFLYSSVRSEVFEHNIDLLIDTYESFFLHDLRILNVPEQDLEYFVRPSWFKDEIKRYGLMGLFGALMVIHAIFMDESGVAELEKNKNVDDYKWTDEALDMFPLMPEKTERILCILDNFIRNFKE